LLALLAAGDTVPLRPHVVVSLQESIWGLAIPRRLTLVFTTAELYPDSGYCIVAPFSWVGDTLNVRLVGITPCEDGAVLILTEAHAYIDIDAQVAHFVLRVKHTSGTALFDVSLSPERALIRGSSSKWLSPPAQSVMLRIQRESLKLFCEQRAAGQCQAAFTRLSQISQVSTLAIGPDELPPWGPQPAAIPEAAPYYETTYFMAASETEVAALPGRVGQLAGEYPALRFVASMGAHPTLRCYAGACHQ